MQNIDHEFLETAIREAARSVFLMMLESDLEEHYAQGADEQPEGGMVALVGLTGTWSGTGCISCSPAIAGMIASRLLLTDPPIDSPVVNEEMMDAIAELTNMVVGNIKNFLEEQIGPMGMSIPTVIYGRNFQLRSFTGTAGVQIPFSWQGGRVDVRLSIAPPAKRVMPDRPRIEHAMAS